MQRMQMADIRELVSDDEGVSPVIGVILMVAITVILAAVIGTFVLGLGNKVTGSTAPSADFGFEWDSSAGKLTVTHQGGDTIDAARLSVAGCSGGCSLGWSGEVTAGDSTTLTNASAGDTVRIVWTSESGGSSQTLASFDVPN